MSTTLIAHSLSRSVWERLLEEPCDARVISVFERACDLMTADGHVIGLVLPVVGNGPLNVVFDGRPGDLSVVEPGMSVWLNKGRLRVADLQINLKKAVIWDARPNWKELRALHNEIQDRLPLLRSSALRHVTEGSLLPLVSQQQVGDEPYLAEVKPLGSTSAIVFAAAREAMGFLQAGWNGDEALLQAGAAQLAGLGGGLTPAGDDFLTGAMIWGWLAHPNPGFLGPLLLEAAAPRTTVLSAALLGAAARGECSAAWHSLLASLFQGKDAELDRAVRDVLAHGATSGADALAGFLWTGLCCT